MPLRPLLIASSVLCAIAITACATANDGEGKAKGIAAFIDDPRLGAPVDKICFSRNIDGFSDNTDDTVVLKRGVNEEYIVEMFGNCQPLRYAQRIGLVNRTSCLTRLDSLIVSESVFGNSTNPFDNQRCQINRIHKWNSKAKDEAEETFMEPGPDNLPIK